MSIIQGDCFTVLPTLPAESADLILFSPPYDNLRNYDGFPELDRVRLGTEMLRVAKDGAICAVVIQDQTENFAKSLTSFRWAVDWVDRCGWRLFETCIYARDGVPGNFWRSRFRVDHEYVHLFLKGARPRYFDKSHLMVATREAGVTRKFGTKRQSSGKVTEESEYVASAEKCRGTIWPYQASSEERNPVKLDHPATFPDKLAADVIRCFSAEGNLVLDPMCGSGTTCVMADCLNRRWTGIEYSERFAEIAKARLLNESLEQCF